MLFSHDFEHHAKLVFDIYDFDNDGVIQKEDIRILLLHNDVNFPAKYSFPLFEGNLINIYSDIENVDRLLDYALRKTVPQIHFSTFIDICTFISPDIFLNLLMLIHNNMPIFQQIILYDTKIISKSQNHEIGTPTRKHSSGGLFSKIIKLSSILSTEPCSPMKTSPQPVKSKFLSIEKSEKKCEENKLNLINALKQAKSDGFLDESDDSDDSLGLDTGAAHSPNITQLASPGSRAGIALRSMNISKSPQIIKKGELMKSPKTLLEYAVCSCGKVVNYAICKTCFCEKPIIDQSGYLFRKRKSGSLSRYWYRLINKDLYSIFLIFIKSKYM